MMTRLKLLLLIFPLFSHCECEQDSLTDFDGLGGITFEVDDIKFERRSFSRRNIRFMDNPQTGNLLFQIGYEGSVNEERTFIYLGIALVDENTFKGRTFTLETENLENFATSSARITKNLTRFETSEIHTGEIFISFFDNEKGIVTGTFFFDAIDSEGNLISVRNGFFDVTYNPGNSSN